MIAASWPAALVAAEPAAVHLPQPPDIVAAGQVMATLNDWRAILFVALVLSALLLFALLWVVGMSFRLVTRQIAANAETAEALRALNTSTVTGTATLSRVESLMAAHLEGSR